MDYRPSIAYIIYMGSLVILTLVAGDAVNLIATFIIKKKNEE